MSSGSSSSSDDSSNNDAHHAGDIRPRTGNELGLAAPPNTAGEAAAARLADWLNDDEDDDEECDDDSGDSSDSTGSSSSSSEPIYCRQRAVKVPTNDEERVTAAGNSLPDPSHASSNVALQLKHIAALEPASVSLDDMMQWVKAKMGRGLETVLDESRRRCKVLVPKAATELAAAAAAAAANQGNNDNTTAETTATPPPAATTPIIVHWPGLEAALESTRKQLCPWFPPGSLHAHLHTVQQYDEGDFFTLHRDAPKLPYHIITMSVDCSPAGVTHEGGDMVIGGAKTRFSCSGSFAAWYNNNYHAVLPVTKGRRLSATYNITVDAAAATAPFNCDDPDIEKAVDEAAAKLHPLESVFDAARSWILDEEYVFDPQYKGNHVFLLRGRDRLRHEAMCRAFGRDRVVLSGKQVEEQRMGDDGNQFWLQGGNEIVDEEEVRERFYSRKPFKEHHNDLGNEGGTHCLWWRVGTLSLQPNADATEEEAKKK